VAGSAGVIFAELMGDVLLVRFRVVVGVLGLIARLAGFSIFGFFWRIFKDEVA